MQTASAAFGTDILGADQTIAYQVMVTFPSGVQASFNDLSSCVVSANWYQQESTTLPDGTTLIAGYPTVQPQIVLEGPLSQGDGIVGVDTQTAYWLFNVNDTTSPMYRQTRLALPVVIKQGLYDGSSTPELITKFTGTIDQIDCSDGQVTLTCRDNRSTITNQAALPPIITNPPYNAGLTSEFAVDYLARHASPAQYNSRPPRRASCVLDVGFRSSIWPELGILPTRFSQGTPTFIKGVNGSALDNQPLWNILYQPVDATGVATSFAPADKMCGRMDSVANASHGFTVNLGDDTGTYQFFISRNTAASGIYVFTNSPGGFSALTLACSAPAGNHTVEFSASWPSGSSTVSGTVWLDGVSHTFSFSAANTRPSGEKFTLVSVQGPIEALQITKETSYATGYPFTPTLILDQSLSPLTALPDVSGQDVGTVFQAIAAAEAAVIGFDELGVLHFTNRNTIQSGTSVRTITSTTSLVTLDSSEQMSLAATHIQVPVDQVVIQPAGTIWNASTPIVLPTHSTTTIYVTTSTPVLAVTPTDSGYYPDTGATPGLSYWRGAFSQDGTGGIVNGGIGFTVAQLSATSLVVSIINTNLFDVWLVSATATGTTTPESTDTLAIGGPVLIIGGQDVIAASAQTIDIQWPPVGSGGAAANPVFGEVLLPVGSSSWLQDIGAATDLANHLLDDLAYPKPQYTNVAIIPDPRLQLLDRVTLIDTDVSQANFDALITGINTTITGGSSGSTWSQALDVRAVYRPGSWVLGLSGRSELSTTTFIY